MVKIAKFWENENNLKITKNQKVQVVKFDDYK